MNEALRKNLFFEGLTDEEYSKLESYIQIKTYPAETILIDEGMPGENLYLLIEGHVRIVKNTHYGQEMILSLRQTGDFFGEMALLDQAPRSARVITNDRVTVGVIPKKAFTEIISHQPRVAINILKIVSARLRQANDHLTEAMDNMEKIHASQILRYQSLLEFSKVLAKEKDEVALFNALPALVMTLIPSDQCALFLQEGETIYTYIRKSTTFEKILYPNLKKFIHMKKPLAIEDLNAEPAWSKLEGFPAQSVLLIPVSVFNKSGLLIVFANHSNRWSYEDQTFLATLSSYVSMMSKVILQ